MKRILPFILIAFLFSCNNQTENTANTDTEETQTALTTVGGDTLTKTTADEPLKHGEIEAEKLPAEIVLGAKDEEQEQNREIGNLFRSGTTAYDNGDFEAGVGFFQQIVGIDPENRRAYYNLGLGNFRSDHFGAALQAFNRAIEIAPDDSLSIQYRGRVYYMLEDFESCLKDYERVVELTPNNSVAYYNRGIAKGQMKDFEGATLDFDKAIELDPDNADAYFNRGLAYYYQGKQHEACYDWQKAYNLGHLGANKALDAYCRQ